MPSLEVISKISSIAYGVSPRNGTDGRNGNRNVSQETV